MRNLFAGAFATLLLASCTHDRTFTIEGSFDVPASFQFGDTVIERDPIEGYVYLMDVNETVIDSALIKDEHFRFEGAVDSRKPYLALICSEYANNFVVIEPGTITAVVDEQVHVSGTPLNDKIVEVENYLENLSNEMYDRVSEFGESVSDSLLFPIYMELVQRASVFVDSVYTSNQDNPVGLYIANAQTADAQTSDELTERLDSYSDYVRDSELMQRRKDYLNSMQDDMDSDMDVDMDVDMDADIDADMNADMVEADAAKP